MVSKNTIVSYYLFYINCDVRNPWQQLYTPKL